MADEEAANYIRVSGRQLGTALVALITAFSSIAVVIGNSFANHGTDTSQVELVDHADRIMFLELAVNTIEQDDTNCKEHQMELERKMDICRTNVAGIKEQVYANNFLIKQCLRITGQ